MPLSDARFLSREACRAMSDRVFALAVGGGTTSLSVDSTWKGSLRWGRNITTASSDTQESRLAISRTVLGASGGSASTNSGDDTALQAAIRRAESMMMLSPQDPETYPVAYPEVLAEIHPHAQPTLWSDRTYALEARERAAIVVPLLARVTRANCSSAGYLEASATGTAVLRNDRLFRYYPSTRAQFSITVHDTRRSGSGWAGVDATDWASIDAAHLTSIAIEKCRRSQNPVAIEPGRYTVILEPQAVCDIVAPLIDRAMDRAMAEMGAGPFADTERPGFSKIGERVIDRRLTLSADPTDPELGFVPFDGTGEPYLNTTWIDHGVLKELAYERRYGLQNLMNDWALPNSRAFRLSGGHAVTEDMIAATDRGILVTRLDNIDVVDLRTLLLTGNTRDGLWLITNGKVTKALKNFRFADSPLLALNRVEQVGVSQHVLRPDAPAVCPALQVRDFQFTALIDAV